MNTLVLGASPNEARYSNKAVKLLSAYKHKVFPVGIRNGEISGIEIMIGKPKLTNIHTVTLYLASEKQVAYYEYILELKPKRIIFNPGTENNELLQLAKENNIEVIEHCTLVMLNTGIF